MDKELSLTIETSGIKGSVAIGLNDELIESQAFSGPLKHSTETLPIIDDLFRKHGLKPDDLNYIYVSAGPGSFTGIRIAVTMAKTLAYAVGAKIVSVPSIEAQALNALQAIEDGIEVKNAAVILEAGRGNIFTGCYRYNPDKILSSISGKDDLPQFETVLPPAMMSPKEAMNKMPRPLHLLGEGINYHKDELEIENIILLDNKYFEPLAQNVFECGKARKAAGIFESADSFVPIYMRKSEAELNWDELGK